MLWRPSYRPIVSMGLELPPLEIQCFDGSILRPAHVVIGGFDALALGETEIWRRLVAEALPGGMIPLGFAVSVAQRGTLEAAIPRSRHATTGTFTDTAALSDIPRDRPERSFAWTPGLLVVGAPTEEVWDEFRQILVQLCRESG